MIESLYICPIANKHKQCIESECYHVKVHERRRSCVENCLIECECVPYPNGDFISEDEMAI